MVSLDWYEKIVKQLEVCITPHQFRSIVTENFKVFGLHSWMVAVQIPSSLHAPETYGINNFDSTWWQEYVENNWVVCDPLPRYAIENHHPRFWTLSGWADVPKHDWANEIPCAVDFFKQVEKFGARSGLIIPYHLGDNTRSCLNLPHPDPIETSRSVLMAARVWVFAIMPQLLDAVRKIYRDIRGEVVVHLTPREKDVLFWAGEGLTSKAIAGRLGLSYRTVEHYLAGIQRKLGVTNRQQAVAKAINLGLVSPIPLLDGMTTFTPKGNGR